VRARLAYFPLLSLNFFIAFIFIALVIYVLVFNLSQGPEKLEPALIVASIIT
jgi:hypothetical protein